MKFFLFFLLAMLTCCNALFGSLNNILVGILHKLTRKGENSIQGAIKQTPEEIIEELKELNNVLRENVHSLKHMVNFHKSSAADSRNEIRNMRRDYADKLRIIQENHNEAVEEMKRQMLAYEAQSSIKLEDALKEFEKQKSELIRTLKEAHAQEIENIRNELTNQIVTEKASAAGIIKELTEKLNAENHLLVEKTKEVEEFRRRQLDAAKDIQDLRKALSKSSSSAQTSSSPISASEAIKTFNAANRIKSTGKGTKGTSKSSQQKQSTRQASSETT